MYKTAGLGALLLIGITTARAEAGPLKLHDPLKAVNRRLAGHVVDHSHNHGKDQRVWSNALGKPRDLYVYLPPGFTPEKRYPFVLWLHGFAQDEQTFLTQVVELIDRAIVCGSLPPLIVAAPDGSLEGHPCLIQAGSFFVNSEAGRFEDWIMRDVWDFMHQQYPLRPEREAHVLAGVSMGGGGAYTLGIKHRDRVAVVLGLMPPLNTRWVDCRGRYMGNFDPSCWGWLSKVRYHEPVGRFYGIITIRMRDMLMPIHGREPNAVEHMSRENPAEQLDRYGLRAGELAMYVGYGGRDQFNIDAQVESFLYLARQRGLTVAVGHDPEGKHDLATAHKMFPAIVEWLGPRLEPFRVTPR